MEKEILSRDWTFMKKTRIYRDNLCIARKLLAKLTLIFRRFSLFHYIYCCVVEMCSKWNQLAVFKFQSRLFRSVCSNLLEKGMNFLFPSHSQQLRKKRKKTNLNSKTVEKYMGKKFKFPSNLDTPLTFPDGTYLENLRTLIIMTKHVTLQAVDTKCVDNTYKH